MAIEVAFDAAVVGGGVMGCTTALHLARGGMRVVVVERRGLGMEASGINAGTLSLQHAPRPELVPYAIRGRELWQNAPAWLGHDMGFRRRGGLVLAFTAAEAETLAAEMEVRRTAGAPIETMSPDRARGIEPGLSSRLVLASYCALDSFVNPSLAGRAFRAALRAAGALVRDGTSVEAIEPAAGGFRLLTGAGTITARRVVLAAGAWNTRFLAAFGLGAPIAVRINLMAVTERAPVAFARLIGVVAGNLSLKQTDSGTVLIGGGWQGRGDVATGFTEAIEDSLVANLRLAAAAVPALARMRVARTWLGFRDGSPDHLPLVGPLPGVAGAFLITCVRDGYLIGPFVGKLLAEAVLGREPERPLFPPARLLHPLAAAGTGAKAGAVRGAMP